MIKDAATQTLYQIDDILNFLENVKCTENIVFTPKEVQDILAKEECTAQANYKEAIQRFKETNAQNKPSEFRRFIVYWGYPGAGKSVMMQKLIDRFAKEESCLPFNVIDKDNHRDIFPNLFNHLKDGHIDECERFAGVTIDYVRTILDLSLQSGRCSVLSIGSMGAGIEFEDNAKKALQYGYRPVAVYMAVPQEISYLSTIYRSAKLYDEIIFNHRQLYPRLVSSKYFNGVVSMLPQMIGKIDNFQKAHAEDVDLVVLNRSNTLLYDSRIANKENVYDVIQKEEHRALSLAEFVTLNMQLYKIYHNMQYRYENSIYPPYKSEIEATKTALHNLSLFIREYDDKSLGSVNGDLSCDLVNKKASGLEL